MYEIPERPADEIARRGEEVYEREIRPRLGVAKLAEHAGSYLVLDIESGDYAIADHALAATRALKRRKPDAVPYLMRVAPDGSARPAYRLGGRSVTAHHRQPVAIRGSVTDDGLEPEVPITFHGRGDLFDLDDVRAVVDTGFTGELTLPLEDIRRLGYPHAGTARGTLADGSETRMSYYEGMVWWLDELRDVAVVAAEGQPLIGMELLDGARLTVEGKPGGEVLIERL